MRVLAVVPARGGSRGVRRKNLRNVAGKTLLRWSIEAALAARLVDIVVVSSEDEEILREAELSGAYACRRPAELATDEAATDPVLAHALGLFPADVVVTLQPTVPVRAPGLVDACVRRLVETGADSVLTANPLGFVWWREEDYLPGAGPEKVGWRSQCARRPRRQDMHARELMWHEDGSVYVTRSALLRATPPRRIGGTIEVFPTERTVDIDTEDDLLMAAALLMTRGASVPLARPA